ncbi:hypothetical protein PG999_003691 [Apiospora kogelbergensis]|uniref:Rhodopsin domain-containing protein n=1 Tax=Apiospora kogelbergensis TaxID=1337665 RepID=A0AAW0R458_9PEZI
MSFTGVSGNSTEWQDYLAEDRGVSELAVIWTFTGVALVFASARWYVRGWMQRRLRSDDYLIAISVATGIVACTLTSVAVSKGIGRHVEALSLEQRITATLWVYAAYCPSVLSFGVPKLAVIALLVRLLVPSRTHFWILWSMGVLVQLALLGVVGLLFGRCQPLLYAIDQSIKGHCLDTKTWVQYCLFTASFSAFVDFYLAAYPSIVLYNLQMDRRRKIVVSIALGLGVVSGGVAIYKTIVLLALSDPDFTYATANITVWTLSHPPPTAARVFLDKHGDIYTDLRRRQETGYYIVRTVSLAAIDGGEASGVRTCVVVPPRM